MEDKGAGAPWDGTHYHRDLDLLWSTRGVRPRPPAPGGSCWAPGRFSSGEPPRGGAGDCRGQRGPSENPFVPAVGPQANSLVTLQSPGIFHTLVNISVLCQPIPGFKHFLVCFQLTPALPSSEFLPPPSPSLAFYPKQVSECSLRAISLVLGGSGPCFSLQGFPMSTFLIPLTTASSLLPDCPRELGPQGPVPSAQGPTGLGLSGTKMVLIPHAPGP